MTNAIEEWDSEDSKLIAEMDDFEENWKHANPCEQYKKVGYCNHLEKAQKRKFGLRVKTQISILSSFVK